MRIEPLALIVGVGITSFILLYIAFNLNNPDHEIIKFILIFCALIILFIIPRTALDYPTNCSIVVGSQNVTSTVISPSVTQTNSTLGYTTYCAAAKDSGEILLKGQMTIFIIILSYAFLFAFWKSIKEGLKRIRWK